MTEQQAIQTLRETGAFLEGHFLLSSGRHSGGYCQCAQLLRFPDKAARCSPGWPSRSRTWA